MARRLLLLGGGQHQLAGVRVAKRLGIETIVMDGDPNAPAFQEADVAVPVSFADVDRAIDLARENRISGVITISTEAGVVPCARVAETLGLPGLSVETAVAATNKVEMRKRLELVGLPTPRFCEVTTKEEAAAFATELGFPCIVKPAVGSGSRGVRKLATLEDVGPAFRDAHEQSRSGQVILEQYMPGEEVHVDALVSDGEVAILGIADKVRTPEPFRTDITVTYPALLSDKVRDEAIAQVVAAMRALGVRNGCSHTELLVHRETVRIVEIAARGAGFSIFTMMLPLISGVDPVEATIRMALGEHPSIKPTEHRSSILSFFNVAPGVLRRVTGLDQARRIPGVVEVMVTIDPGDRINPYRSGDDRIGYFIVHADTRDEAESIAQRVRQNVVFEVEPNA
jgi:biotin carboxylase